MYSQVFGALLGVQDVAFEGVVIHDGRPSSSYVLVGLCTFQDGKTCPIVAPTVPSCVSLAEVEENQPQS